MLWRGGGVCVTEIYVCRKNIERQFTNKFVLETCRRQNINDDAYSRLDAH